MKKWLKLSKKQIALFSVLLVLVLLCSACLIAYSNLSGAMQSQLVAKRFRGESGGRFSQVSAFFANGNGKTFKDIYTFREKIDPALAEAAPEEPGSESGTLWKDAYCGQAEVSVSGNKGSTTVTTLGVGGDWFYFHQLRLRSGSYISETDLMHDSVVLDEALAWQLFGSFDLAGMEVTIGGNPYIVAGVVQREDDSADKRAYMGEGGMFMHFDAMDALTPDVEETIDSYEMVCADPITGFALNILETGFSLKDNVTAGIALENTGRFSYGGSLAVIEQLGTRSMSQVSIVLPYWENAARYTEDILAVLLVAAIIFGLFPFGLVAYCIIRLLVRGWKKLRHDILPDAWERLSDKIRERQRIALLEKTKKRDARDAQE